MKSQSAMEYLMTYGWAILIIAVVLGVLFQLGVFSSSSFAPRASPGSCKVFRPAGPGTSSNLNLVGVCSGQLPQFVGSFSGVTNQAINLPTLNTGSSITESAWLYVTAGNGNEDWFIWTTNGGQQIFLIVAPSGSSWGFYTYITDSASAAYYNTVYPLNYNQWYLVTFTYDSSGNFNQYVNGVNKFSHASGLVVPPAFSQILRISGHSDGGYYRYYAGLISNVQVYNTSLDASYVQALYREGIGGAPVLPSNLIGWWPLNGDANDYSGNNNNGVPTSVTFTSQYGK